MAITIRNKETEAMIRRIGARNGEGPSATVHRLAERALEETPSVAPPEVQAKRRAEFEELWRKYPRRPGDPSFEEAMKQIDSIQSDLHD